MQDARALLDSLMGGDRDNKEGAKKEHHTDRGNCKYWMINYCPHECFLSAHGKVAVNSPIGECPKAHKEFLKTQFNSDPDKEYYTYKYKCDLIVYLEGLVRDCDAKAKREKDLMARGTGDSYKRRQMALVGQVAQPDNAAAAAARCEVKIRDLEKQITAKMQLAQDAAEKGEISASSEAMREVEMLKKAIEQQNDLLIQNRNKAELTGEKINTVVLDQDGQVSQDIFQEDVCDICGLVIDWRSQAEVDARRRGVPHPHETGALHTGFLMIRQKIKDLKAEIEEIEKNGRPRKGGARDSPGRGDRDRDRDRRGGDRDRDDRGRRDDDRDRDRDRRDRDRDRDRYNDRDRRDRDRDRRDNYDRRGGGRDRSRERRR